MEAKRPFSAKGLTIQANNPINTFKKPLSLINHERAEILINCLEEKNISKWLTLKKKWQMLAAATMCKICHKRQMRSKIPIKTLLPTFFCFSNCASFPCSLQKEQRSNTEKILTPQFKCSMLLFCFWMPL